MKLHRFLLLVASAIVLMGAGIGQVAFAEDTDSEEYVPRSEYEKLKQEVETLKQEVKSSKPQTSDAAAEGEGQTPAQAQEEAGQEAKGETGQEAQAEEDKGLVLLPKVTLIPGWELYRMDGWMSPSWRHVMQVPIAQLEDMTLFMGLDTVGRFQYLSQSDVEDTVGTDSVTNGPLEPSFQTAFGNLSFLADFNGDIEVYFDIFIADRAHPDQLQGDEGYMLIRHLPGPVGDWQPVADFFDYLNVKAGEFQMAFGDAIYRRSLNARTQSNPLIGNYVIDPRATEIGMEIYTKEGKGPILWLVGLGSGTQTGDFESGQQPSLHGKVWVYPCEDLRVSGSIYWANESSNAADASRVNLFRTNRSGGPYAAVLSGGVAPGQVFPVSGQAVLATQVDATWTSGPWELYSNFGYVEDADNNGNAPGHPESEWLYWAAEGVYHFTPRLYAAGRYSGARALRLVSSSDSSMDVGSDGIVNRFQIGGGYWFAKTILAKVEYVYQFYDGFSSDGSQVSGVDAWLDPSFNGVIMEVSFAF